MPIIVNLDVMMAKRKISLNELSERVGLTLSNLSILKTGKAKAIRFSTLEAICRALDCQPSDILEYVNDEKKTTKGNITLMRFSLLISIIQLYVVPNSCKSLLFLIRM